MNKTRIALLQKAISLAGSYRIAYPNTEFTPVQGETYLKFDFAPASNNPITLGTTGEDEFAGFFQVAIMSPAGDGDGDALALADAFRAGFKNGSNLSYSDRLVRIRRAEFTAGSDVNIDPSVWYTNYITIYWTARLARN